MIVPPSVNPSAFSRLTSFMFLPAPLYLLLPRMAVESIGLQCLEIDFNILTAFQVASEALRRFQYDYAYQRQRFRHSLCSLLSCSVIESGLFACNQIEPHDLSGSSFCTTGRALRVSVVAKASLWLFELFKKLVVSLLHIGHTPICVLRSFSGYNGKILIGFLQQMSPATNQTIMPVNSATCRHNDCNSIHVAK